MKIILAGVAAALLWSQSLPCCGDENDTGSRTVIHENFESYLAGETPVFRALPAARIDMNGANDILTVPGGVDGRHALSFQDDKGGVFYFPQLSYQTPLAGNIAVSFDFMLDSASPGPLQFILRDNARKPYLDLFSLVAAADGTVQGPLGSLGTVAKGQWNHLDLRYTVGSTSADVRVTSEGRTLFAAAVPAPRDGVQADCVIFCGIGNEKGRFYLDNIRISGKPVAGTGIACMPLSEVLTNAPASVPIYDIPLAPVSAEGVTLTPDWGLGDAQTLTSATRRRICLNGLWAVQPSAKPPELAGVPPPKAGDWAFVKVPHWMTPSKRYLLYGEDRVSWKMPEGSPPRTVWYARNVTLPAMTPGQRVYLDLAGLPGYAVRVYWDGRLVGELSDQLGGRLDLTPALRSGKETGGQLLLYALSIAPDSLACYVETGLLKRQYRPAETSGLMDAYLSVEPSNAVYRTTPIYQGVRALPSVRKQRLDFQVDCPAGANAPTHTVIVRDRDGNVVLRKSGLSGARSRAGVLSLSVPWKSPRCWSPDDPYLHTFVLQARNAAGDVVDETLPETFGFREVWAQGKRLMLNGQPLRLRVDGEWVAYKDGATTRRFLSFMKDMGFNCIVCPPAGDFCGSEEPRGNVDEYFRLADETGMLAIPRVPYLQEYQTEKVTPVLEYMDRRMMARLANHPSVIAYRMWMSGEVGYPGVDRPDIWGMKPSKTFGDMQKLANLSPQDRETKRRQFARTQAYIDGARALDTSRLIFEHTGVGMADIWGTWSYWNWLPVQEYSDRVRPWAERGVIPIGITEGGLPYTGSFLRHGADDTMEPMLTEYSAMRLGPGAYLKETSRYVDAIRTECDPGTKMWSSTYSVSSMVHDFRNDGVNLFRWEAANTLDVWAEQNRLIYRAWRTYGVPGGRDPFHGLFYYREGAEAMTRKQQIVANPKEDLKTPGMKEDRWWSSFATSYWDAFPDTLPPGSPLTPTGRMPPGLTRFGEAMQLNDSELLLYIAGPPDRFTAKDHVFWSGERVTKQVAVVWDGFHTRRLGARWTVTLGAQPVAEGMLNIQVKGGDIMLRPLEFDVPPAATRSEGAIDLSVTDLDTGKTVATDRFAFQVYPLVKLSDKARSLRLALFDPQGQSGRVFGRLGLKPRKVMHASDLQGADLLVIGRGALLEFGTRLLAQLPAGLPVLVLEQKSEDLETLGFRAYPICERTVFPLPTGHPVLEGVSASDLRDWRVDPQLLPEGFDPLRPGYNYHIGNRGTVASVTIETPTQGNFTPLLQSGCDLRETPLLEWIVDGRRWMFCQLSVSDPMPEKPRFVTAPEGAAGAADDPVATRLLVNLLDYMREPITESAPCAVLGAAADLDLLRDLGAGDVKTCRVEELDGSRAVVVGKTTDTNSLKAWVEQGGTAVVLPQDESFYRACVPSVKVETKTASLIPFSNVPPSRIFAGLGQNNFHYRQALTNLIFASGANVDAIAAGKGRWILIGFDPRNLDLTNAPWLIMTYRNQCRALAQILANAGVSLESASRSLLKQMSVASGSSLDMPKTGARMIKKDTSLGNEWVKPDFDDHAWDILPSYDANTGVGHAYIRIRFQAPAQMATNGYLVDLGIVYDYDEVYLNGIKIATDDASVTPEGDIAAKHRQFPLPPKALRPGRENVLAIYVWNRNWESQGWTTSVPGPISIHTPEPEHRPYAGTYYAHDDPYIWRSW